MELKLQRNGTGKRGKCLLIVPYGIETKESAETSVAGDLLIVPYGIETKVKQQKFHLIVAFNRTLWNWNPEVLIEPLTIISFNRTLWNWNIRTRNWQNAGATFNHTLWNWNNRMSQAKQAGVTFNRTLWNWNLRGLFLVFVRLCF